MAGSRARMLVAALTVAWRTAMDAPFRSIATILASVLLLPRFSALYLNGMESALELPLLALLTLAVVEAGLGMMYFMHLKYERRTLFWSLIPALIFVFLMMNQFWSDAYRLRSLGQ